MAAVIEVTTDIFAPRTRVFDLERDVDVHSASLSGSGETATTSSGRRILEYGDEVTFRARHFGLRWEMTSCITEFERPGRFVDQQTSGPFRTLVHEHGFEETASGQTRMTDRMSITLPGGPLGVAIARLVAAPYLRRLLRQRADHIKFLAEQNLGPATDGPASP